MIIGSASLPAYLSTAGRQGGASSRLAREPFRALQKVMKNTETTMNEAATKVLVVKGSPPNAHPRKIATTGLTKAKVDTHAGAQTLNNHM